MFETNFGCSAVKILSWARCAKYRYRITTKVNKVGIYVQYRQLANPEVQNIFMRIKSQASSPLCTGYESWFWVLIRRFFFLFQTSQRISQLEKMLRYKTKYCCIQKPRLVTFKKIIWIQNQIRRNNLRNCCF